MKKILALLILMAIFIPSAFAKEGLSVGGSLDMDMGSNKDTTASGSLNIEYKPINIFSLGFKVSGKTDFEESLTATPSVFARFYPFGGAFLEGSIGGNLLWKGTNINLHNMVAGAALGWRITSGKSYIEPKVNLEYVFGAPEPYSWSAGVGAGYTF